MSAKYTKGPWESVKGTASGRLVIAPDAPGVRRNVAACGGQNRDANARAISALADLIDALKGAIGALEFSRDYHRDLGNEDQDFAQEKLDAAIAALAKAEASA